ncbi:DinB family protein [Hazenella sp. IB182357]|uniref:DinB family protein n=1 Tax=Polycladospora coralii TaxID=2771432 RepID=A0A926RTM5_9BACL|nr:DinB family protein [Polycladospora coralii]MBD1371354.1 DinB family protein [Polycladospora coralii]MBS7530322.1 DinB family protein [Polycladospora coralii]
MEALTKIRADLVNLVSSLNEEEINYKPHKENWSIAQVLFHLALVEKAVTFQLSSVPVEKDEPIPEKPILLTLDRTVKVKVPTPDFEPKNSHFHLPELIEKLSKTRAKLLETYERYDKEKLHTQGFTHPAYGLLHIEQWLQFIRLHEQRHLEQIKDIKLSLLINQ